MANRKPNLFPSDKIFDGANCKTYTLKSAVLEDDMWHCVYECISPWEIMELWFPAYEEARKETRAEGLGADQGG